jgi:hypothetical protein
MHCFGTKEMDAKPSLTNTDTHGLQANNCRATDSFDTRKCHEAIAARGAAAIKSPRKNAKP